MFPHLHHTYAADELVHYVRSPQDGADRWATNAGAAQAAYTRGVQDTQIDVVGRAVAQQDTMLANFTQAITSGLWARRLTESGGTANWKAQTIAKASNFGSGVQKAKGRYLAAAQTLYPYIATGQAQVASMAKGTLADSKARAAFWIDYMAAYRQSR